MADKSAIEWTDATWNPIVGCSILTPGCTNCYAMKMAARIERMHEGRAHYAGTTKSSKAGAVWTGKMALAPDATLTAPLRWKRGRRIFVNSMGDLFHESIPDEWIDRVFAVMALCPQHTFQVLTKRAERMRNYMVTPDRKRTIAEHSMPISCMLARDGGHTARIKLDHFSACFAGAGPFKNVWLGVSTERQQEANERIPLLLQTPAAVRFISAEPLLGPISLRWAKWDDWKDLSGKRRQTVDHLDGARMLDWVIVGGESGSGARPMHPQWARDLRDQCSEAGVNFFFKQWGEWRPSGGWIDGQLEHGTHGVSATTGKVARAGDLMCGNVSGKQWAGYGIIRRVGKKAAGRLLDGREHNEFPEARV